MARSGKLHWEHTLLPSLLAGAGTWLGEIQEALNLCECIHKFVWGLVLEEPESCLNVALRTRPRMI